MQENGATNYQVTLNNQEEEDSTTEDELGVITPNSFDYSDCSSRRESPIFKNGSPRTSFSDEQSSESIGNSNKSQTNWIHARPKKTNNGFSFINAMSNQRRKEFIRNSDNEEIQIQKPLNTSSTFSIQIPNSKLPSTTSTTPRTYTDYFKSVHQFRKDSGSAEIESIKFLYNNIEDSDPSDEDYDERMMTWNEAFQKALEMPQNNDKQKLKRSDFIATISQDFVQTAILYGKIIISEVFLPDEHKTIKPTSSVGGNAGGEKYLFNGILFKFAVDWKDIYTSDMYAMKSASHELKGLELFFEMASLSPALEKIKVPLMTIIDYLGFRLIALSLLPINHETIVYGSNDSGIVVNAQSPYDKIMEDVGNQMNLSMHVAGLEEASTANIPFPADIEGHEGKDGRFYILDFARIMPPTLPSPKGPPNQYLYKLFRPEFVTKYKTPLNPDSFSNFDRHDPNRLKYRQDIEEATNALYEYIPQKISAMEIACEFTDKTNLSQFVELIHKAGINIRYLSLARKNASSYIKALSMIEMISRGIKNHLRKVLREAKREKKVMAMHPYRQAILHELNTILGNTPEYKKRSILFWNALHDQLELQFIDFPSKADLSNEIITESSGIYMMNDACPSAHSLEDILGSIITYECFTCGIVYPQGICQVCTKNCHFNHSISKVQFRTKTFCSCEKGCKKKHFKLNFMNSEYVNELKSMAEALGIHRVLHRVSELAGIKISKDALKELEASPKKFIFVLPDIKKLRLKRKQITIATLSEARSLHLHGITQTKVHERIRIFHQSNVLFEKTIRLYPGSLMLRSQFLDLLYEQIVTCESIDDKILTKFVEYCQDQRDIDKAKNIVLWIHTQGDQVIQKSQESVQECFSIILKYGRDLKVKERMELLEFIAEYGTYILSLDLNYNEYSTIVEDQILLKIAEKCVNLHYFNLKYLPRKVSMETLIIIPQQWKLLRHVDLNSCSINDSVVDSFVNHCTNIISLDISGCHNITNDVFKSISKLSSLNVLNISYNESLSDIGTLSICKKMELLTMKQCKLMRIQFTKLASMGSNLKFLDCSNCEVDNSNVLQDILTFCPKLRHLIIDGWTNGKEKQLFLLPKSLRFLSVKGWALTRTSVTKLKKIVKLIYDESDIALDQDQYEDGDEEGRKRRSNVPKSGRV